MHQEILIQLKEHFGEQVEIDFHDERWDGKHFFLDICSEKFIWKSRIEQSKMVYGLLDTYMKTGYIHALRMKCRTPEG